MVWNEERQMIEVVVGEETQGRRKLNFTQ